MKSLVIFTKIGDLRLSLAQLIMTKYLRDEPYFDVFVIAANFATTIGAMANPRRPSQEIWGDPRKY